MPIAHDNHRDAGTSTYAFGEMTDSIKRGGATDVTVAVLITYHNEASLLTECLNSLQCGISQPDEILIYDDSSTISPEPYLPSGMPVRVIKGTENRGPSHGRNMLLAASRSSHVHFHDADDLFAPDWYLEVRAMLGEADIDAVFTEIEAFRDGQQTPVSRTDLTVLTRNPDLVRYCLSHGLLTPSGTYRRERLLAIGGYSEKYWQSEDFDFHLRLANAGLRFRVIPRPLIRQRLHTGSRSRDLVRVWSDAVQILKNLAGELRPEYRPDICDSIVNAGRILYSIGATAEAKRAFAAASQLGKPRFCSEVTFYRIVARTCGPMFAEHIGRAYRSLVPNYIRARLRG